MDYFKVLLYYYNNLIDKIIIRDNTKIYKNLIQYKNVIYSQRYYVDILCTLYI